ncbi:DUF1015 domain-containing protein [Anaerobium acetethylicum]|uniref:Uncharacterized conserved protein, DUF1015 family n=1 Tax=Anaerobium acetethylicum TaxID=1619234 RepID=A0A1D3TVE8_9FIRM|nr:DUF1015 family protein [Anaerobium acetethylicum]SCP98116.1 Uncharacterized conserved protein, DUF1015 family [Anaerobium acetethylicum]
MAIVKPFKCIRPRQDLASKIAALPYDVYNRNEALEEVKKEPLSFLKIDRAETQFDDSVDTYDERVYQRAHSTLWGMIEEGLFEQDGKKCYYIYELTMAGRAQTGIVACASIDDYENNIIKKHENTRADKEIDRINHVNICNAQTGPIFLAYRSNEAINAVIEAVRQNAPVYDFTSDDGVRHAVWKIEEDSKINAVGDAFAAINDIYIADGHHRAASAVKVGKMRREANPGYTGEEEFNFFLSVLFPNDQLMILPYNRVVKDLNGLSRVEFLSRVGELFEIENLGTKAYAPESKGCFGMFLEKEWYKLAAHKNLLSEDPVEGLDVSILQNSILAPILGIGDPRTDKRIDFIGGIRGLEELEKRAGSDMKLAFSMYPTSIDELFAVSDANLLMPPKSTWFEPKLRSGLFIHSLSE